MIHHGADTQFYPKSQQKVGFLTKPGNKGGHVSNSLLFRWIE